MQDSVSRSAVVKAKASGPAPLISVVLPTYNRAALLPASLDSILAQSERDLEVIVVDDGSPDATGEVIGQYSARDSRITHVWQANAGLPAALNQGFRWARGRYWTWTSDDNRYFPSALTLMTRPLLAHPEVGLVWAKMRVHGPTGTSIFPPEDPLAYWHGNTFGGAFLYRQALAVASGEYDERLRMVEDYDFFLRLTYRTRVWHLPEVVYEYADHENSLTQSRKPQQIRALEQLVHKHVRLGLARPWQLSHLAATVARSYRELGQTRDALRMAWWAWRLWPLNGRSYLSAGRTLISRVIGH